MTHLETHPEEITRLMSLPKYCDRCGNLAWNGYRWHTRGSNAVRLCLICDRLAELEARRTGEELDRVPDPWGAGTDGGLDANPQR